MIKIWVKNWWKSYVVTTAIKIIVSLIHVNWFEWQSQYNLKETIVFVYTVPFKFHEKKVQLSQKVDFENLKDNSCSFRIKSVSD